MFLREALEHDNEALEALDVIEHKLSNNSNNKKVCKVKKVNNTIEEITNKNFRLKKIFNNCDMSIFKSSFES